MKSLHEIYMENKSLTYSFWL